MRNMDVWVHGHLTWVIEKSGRPNIVKMVLATVTLVNFPGFQDVHHPILEVFEDHDAHVYAFDQWGIYVKYRQFLAEFLTDQSRSGALFVGAAHYIYLSILLWTFLENVTGDTSEK